MYILLKIVMILIIMINNKNDNHYPTKEYYN